MKALLMEFRKTHRRKIWIIVAALIGVQLLWAFWSISRMDTGDMEQGWLFCLYQFPVLNAIMMPVVAAVLASRLSDVEHKGQTLRLLTTIMTPGKLFDAKFLCGTVYMAAVAGLQILLIVVIGTTKGFGGAIPLGKLIYYLFSTIGVSLTILLLQQILSLLFINQMIPFAVGLVGSLAGIYAMFLPQNLGRILLWAYYGVLMPVGLDWQPEADIVNYYSLPIDWSGVITLCTVFIALYLIGRGLFTRKEV